MVLPAGSLGAAGELFRAARLYWLALFPQVCSERRRWARRARQIPDKTLRDLALTTIEQERGNVEGACAFTILAGASHRIEVLRTLVTFQIIYDYVDTLVEQPAANVLSNGLRLHLALHDITKAHAERGHYYAFHPFRCDGGYLTELVDACRLSFARLPSRRSVSCPLRLAISKMRVFQGLNHGGVSLQTLARWSQRQAPTRCGLRWWEIAAATASSLTAFALIVASSHPDLQARSAWKVHRAYFPWIAALHVLLDSLLDQQDDLAVGRHSLIGHYDSPEEAAHRIGLIAAQAVRHAEALDTLEGARALEGAQALENTCAHRMILASMASFYLSAAPRDSPYTRKIAPAVLSVMGELARPTMLIMRARRKAVRLKSPRIARPRE